MVSMVTRNFGVRRCAKTKTVVGLHVLSALVTLRIYVVLNLSTNKTFQVRERSKFQSPESGPKHEAGRLARIIIM